MIIVKNFLFLIIILIILLLFSIIKRIIKINVVNNTIDNTDNTDSVNNITNNITNNIVNNSINNIDNVVNNNTNVINSGTNVVNDINYSNLNMSEIKTLSLLKNNFNVTYLYWDLYCKKYNNEWTQIDFVLITNVGLIIIEVKDYKGGIFGNINDLYWKQILFKGSEKLVYPFYNPVKQNNTHIKALLYNIKENIPCFSVIVFSTNYDKLNIKGDCHNTIICDYSNFTTVIKNIVKNNNVYKFKNKHFLTKILNQFQINGLNKTIRNSHLNSLQKYKLNKNLTIC